MKLETCLLYSIKGYAKMKLNWEKTGFVIVHVRSTAKIVFGYICIGASCYNCNNIRAARTNASASELCADNDRKNTLF